MTLEEFTKLVEDNDKKVGRIEKTLSDDAHRQRKIKLLHSNENLTELIQWLLSNTNYRIMLFENISRHNSTFNMLTDIFIPKLRIAICVERSKKQYQQRYYDSVKHLFHPIFIRDNESYGLLLTKVKNVIEKRSKCKFKKELDIVYTKKERKRIRVSSRTHVATMVDTNIY